MRIRKPASELPYRRRFEALTSNEQESFGTLLPRVENKAQQK
jgi:hypothetical protein